MRVFPLCCAALAVFLAVVGLATPVFGANTATPLTVDTPLVFTQVPVQVKWGARKPGEVRVPGDWFAKSRVVVLSTNGQVQILSQGFESACDPDVSFDGRTVLFSGRKRAGSPWRVWEIGLDGQGLRPVTPEDMDARQPIYVSTLFTLDSPQPWFTFVFVGLEETINETGRPLSSSLYNLKLDGTELRRLTYNPNNNFSPMQVWDGRLVYSAERNKPVPDSNGPWVGLYAVHVEGADMEFYGGELGGSVQHMACTLERDRIVFIEPDERAGDGAGRLACVEERRPHVTYERLTKRGRFLYLYPTPLREKTLLVSRRSAGNRGQAGLCTFDLQSRECEPLFDTAQYHELQVKVAKPRSRPDGHSTVVNTYAKAGVFYGLNCYDTDGLMGPHLRTGMVKRVRLIEGVPQSNHIASPTTSPGLFVPRRLVGEAPVEPDGSFNVEVPADTPLLLQTLDERGLALATCGWIWVKPKESRGCIGCHEDPERIPENEYVLALRRLSNRLTLEPGQRRMLNFRDNIASILREHCATAECHAGKRAPLRMSGLQASEPDVAGVYALLVPGGSRGTTTSKRRARYIHPGQARTSPLIWRLLGENTSRPWDPLPASPSNRVGMLQNSNPDHRGLLDDAELMTLIQWIDLGALFSSSPTNSATTMGDQTSVR